MLNLCQNPGQSITTVMPQRRLPERRADSATLRSAQESGGVNFERSPKRPFSMPQAEDPEVRLPMARPTDY